MSRVIDVSRPVAATPDIVWQVLTDISGADLTLSGVEKIEILTPGEYLPGYRWLETRKMFGVRSTQEIMVQESAPPHTTTLYSMSQGIEYLTTFTAAPQAGGTLLGVRFTSEIKHAGFAASVTRALFGGLGQKAMEKTLRQDLDDIAAAAEGLQAY